jgi:hypothetical protein
LSLSLAVIGCCLALFGGCTTKLPLTAALTADESIEAHERLQHFLKQSCVPAIDSDVRLGWQALGGFEQYSATLQLAEPASLRLALTDPLGRSLYLLAGHDSIFTFVDKLQGKGYTGVLQADSVQQYLPQGLNPKDIFYWLSGRLTNHEMQIVSLSRGVEDTFLWYEVQFTDGERHLLGIDTKNLRRHLVVDNNNRLILNVTYSHFFDTPAECDWPGRIDIKGDGLSPDYRVEFVKSYSFTKPDAHIFRLHIPAHFTRHTLQ